jgi:hypothetical protein
MQVRPSDYKPVEQITPQDILRFTSSERTRNKALPPLKKWLENSRMSIKELNRKPSKEPGSLGYSPLSNIDDEGLFMYVLEKNIKLNPEKCIPHSTSIEGLNLLLNKRQDCMSTALPIIEKIIDELETMRNLTLIGILGPAVTVCLFEQPKASEKDPINCPRRTAVRKWFAEELSQKVRSESQNDLELCTRYIQGEFSRIVSITDSKALLQMAGKTPRLIKTYDKMVLINKSKIESGDVSVKKLIKHRESIHNWFYTDLWQWRVSLDYAIKKLVNVMPTMFHGYR